MSEEDGTADCSHMILASVGLQSFLLLRRKPRGPRAGATPASDTCRARGGTLQRTSTWQRLVSHSQRCAGAFPASDTFRGQRRHSPTHFHLATPRQPFSTLRRSYPCLGHISWPEAALSSALPPGNASSAFSTLRRSFPCLGHISWPEAALSNALPPGNASAAILNAAPELPLPRTHFVARGGTLQRTHTWQRLGSHSQRCCGGRPDPAMGQKPTALR